MDPRLWTLLIAVTAVAVLVALMILLLWWRGRW